MSRSVRDPDYRRDREAEAAGRALFLTQHPHCNASTWPLLDQPTREWWTVKAAPILDAIREARA